MTALYIKKECKDQELKQSEPKSKREITKNTNSQNTKRKQMVKINTCFWETQVIRMLLENNLHSNLQICEGEDNYAVQVDRSHTVATTGNSPHSAVGEHPLHYTYHKGFFPDCYLISLYL